MISNEYSELLQQLQKVCRNKYLVRMLSLKENNYNRAKLIHELQKSKTNHQIPKSPTPEIPISKEPDIITDNSPLTTDDSPIDLNNMSTQQTIAAVEKLEVALGKMHNKKGMLSNSLRNFDAKDNEGRKKILDQIDGLNDDMNEIRDKLNYFEKNGKLPPIKQEQEKNIFDEIPADPVAMNKLLLNERSNISKYKKKLKGELTDKLRTNNANRLTESTLIVSEIERRLNAI